MGNKSSKSSSFFCFPCRFDKSRKKSLSSSIDEKQFPTFDRLSSNEKISPNLEEEILPLNKNEEEIDKITNSSVQNRRSVSLHNVVLNLPEIDKIVESKPPIPNGKNKISSAARRSFRTTLAQSKKTFYSQSIEDLEKSLHGASSIEQWIDSLPVLGTPSLNRNKTVIPLRNANSAQKIKRSFTVGDDNEQKNLNRTYQQEIENCSQIETSIVDSDFSKLFGRYLFPLSREIQLERNLNDFLNRLKNPKSKEKFCDHFSSSSVIHPLAGPESALISDLEICNYPASEYILPIVSSNSQNNYKLNEEIRSKSFFYPISQGKIEIKDEEYENQSKQLDLSHVVITLETRSKIENDENFQRPKKCPIDFESTGLVIFDDSFCEGFVRVEIDKLAKHWRPFVRRSTEENFCYLSSSSIQQWLKTLILVNQTCDIARRFLKGDGSHITCLIKEPTNSNSLTFAALRLPVSMFFDSTSTENFGEENRPSIDGFSSNFLSDNTNVTNDTIHIDYEKYSFAFLLHRWPKILLENFHRRANRRWPSNYQMNILIKQKLLLVPTGNEDRWKIEFSPVEQNLFEFIPETSLCFYAFTQRILGLNDETRTIVKHCFLNFSEINGLPFSSFSQRNKKTFVDVFKEFSSEIHRQLVEQSILHYFNRKLNLFSTIDKVDRWTEHVQRCSEREYFTNPSSSSIVSNRPIMIEFLFHFVDQLYQSFHLKRSQFHLNENVLLDLHQQVCEKFSNDSNNNNSASLQKIINELLNNNELLENIQISLTSDFETNAELVHNCLNQVRKADSSLIFHYTWTIYIQFLHTYYNALWNI